MIHHFKLYTEGFVVPTEETYTIVEAPKGEFVFIQFLIQKIDLSDVVLKLQAFYILQGLDFMSRGSYLADLVTIIGTQDLVFVKSIVKLIIL